MISFFLFGDSKEYYEFIQNTLKDEADSNRWFELTGDIAFKAQEFIEYFDTLERSLYENEDNSSRELLYMLDESFFRDLTRKRWEEKLLSYHRLTINSSFLSDYKFTIKAGHQEVFKVDVKPKDNISVKLDRKSLPLSVSNNVFCIIGENGSGKTRFIRELSKAILNEQSEITIENSKFDTQDDANVMNRVLYFSFSPFDDSINIDLPSKDADCFEYVGILNYDEVTEYKNIGDRITADILESLKIIKISIDQSKLWLEAMERIIFEEWVANLIYIFKNDLVKSDEIDLNGVKTSGYTYIEYDKTYNKIKNFSSGQKILLLTITKLILKLTERTIVFVDEPELFLHPPMIKSYVRLISDIVNSVNGLGFIITHSPITLQEFPSRCVKQAYHDDYLGEYLIKSVNFNTFGENINVINDKIFNIGLQQSGYYNLIERLKFSENAKSELRKLLEFSGSEARLLINLFLEGTSE